MDRPIPVLVASALLSLSGFAAGCGDQGTANDAGEDADALRPPVDGGADQPPPPDDGAPTPDAVEPEDVYLPPDVPLDTAIAILEIHALDIWSQPLDGGAALTVTAGGRAVATSGFPVAWLPLAAAGRYAVRLTAPDFESLGASVIFDGAGTADGVSAFLDDASAGAGLALTHGERMIDGRMIPVHSLFLGLRHRWFSAEARPARRGNSLRLMMDGEEAWSTIHEAMAAATDSILVASWWWESDFEMVRDPLLHPYLTEEERWHNTILGTLAWDTPATKRVLVGQFWGQDSILSWMTTDPELRAFADFAGDGFEFMGQANETEGIFWFAPTPFLFGDRVRATHPDFGTSAFEPESEIESRLPQRTVDLTAWPVGVDTTHASYHQKFSVIDGATAFVGGMNFTSKDWDTSQHLVFEPRRARFETSVSDREDIAALDELPPEVPRKDYFVRIVGPLAQDVADVFHERWDYNLAMGVEYSENSSDFTVERDIPAVPGGVQAQITTTLPDPFWEHGIAETWFNAVANAERFIYIEDQYFRIPLLVDAIVARMDEVPGLRLVVITDPIGEYTDPGCYWTRVTDERLRTRFPDRYMMLQVRSFASRVTWGIDETEGVFSDIYIHAKMMIVDDVFLSVGSCNKNNRGILYEGEMSIAVLDPAWVRAARRRIFANLMPGAAETDSVDEWWSQLHDFSVWNDYVYSNWELEGGDINIDGGPLPEMYTPFGFLYTLPFGPPDDCLLEPIGPDVA
jgi:phosphatidylserine/phosphatidylglycerophosphate/cardiolipin synthase-like enzyme